MKSYLKLSVLPLFILCLSAFMCVNKKNKQELAAVAPNQEVPKLSLADTSLKKITKSDAVWKKELSSNQYHVLREKGTEPPFENAYHDNHKSGNYFCAGCKLPLFSSKTKFNSGTGWPSFFDVLNKNRVKEIVDTSHGMVRGEIVCARCGGHLGHLFDDGPSPTGLRYCMNSASMVFQEAK